MNHHDQLGKIPQLGQERHLCLIGNQQPSRRLPAGSIGGNVCLVLETWLMAGCWEGTGSRGKSSISIHVFLFSNSLLNTYLPPTAKCSFRSLSKKFLFAADGNHYRDSQVVKSRK